MTHATQSAEHTFAYGQMRLSCATRDGEARAAALGRDERVEAQPTSIVSYTSRGSVLIVGPYRTAVAAAEVLADKRLECTIVYADDGAVQAVADRPNALCATLSALSGHLGQFRAAVATADGNVDLARVLGRTASAFDLVLDLGTPPSLAPELPPPGYYATGSDDNALAHALAALPEMVGEFEKPKYFNYNPDICAHGRSGLPGCTRCLDACPADAIRSLRELIEVDPYLCQGGGGCATACPTGAITYAYPPASDLLGYIRRTPKAYLDAGGSRPCLLFHDDEAGREQVERLGARLPEWVIPLQVEEIGAVGLDAWLSALAFGAEQVALLATPALPQAIRRETTHQLAVAHALLEGLGYDPKRLRLLGPDEDQALVNALGNVPAQATIQRASFATHDEKRNTLRMALDHLYEQAPRPIDVAPLPAGAPFGEITVDREKCTLCMACTSVCPASAVMAGGDKPQLRFIEWNCVQCGLCEVACPEEAITLNPRIVYAPELRNRQRVLNEQQPFCCVNCGKPFATRSMMHKMTAKLKGHWMFQDPQSIRRIQMCEDCRVRDLFASEPAPDVHNKPRAQ